MYHTRGLIVLLVWLGLACLASAQSQSCPLITINDLGSTTEFSTNGLVARGIIPPGDTSSQSIFVRIVSFNVVCSASGDRIDTSSYVSVIVQLQCNSTNVHSTLADCNGSTMITRQYQFQCIEDNGQPAWDAIVSGSNMNVQTLTPTATFSTPLANQCRRCIDDQQSSRADPITHCDSCPSQCDQGLGRCYLGAGVDVCCSFYLQNNCTAECPSPLVNDSNSNCVCSDLTLENGAVRYLPAGRPDIESMAIHICNPGYRLSSPQAGNTRTCSMNGWTDQNFTCELIQCPDLLSDSINDGKVIVTPTARTVNSTAEYTCNDGYKLEKGDAKRTCQNDGTWSGEAPECNKVGFPIEIIVAIAVVAAVVIALIIGALTVLCCCCYLKSGKEKTQPVELEKKGEPDYQSELKMDKSA